jgi:hypothetical protein
MGQRAAERDRNLVSRWLMRWDEAAVPVNFAILVWKNELELEFVRLHRVDK